MFNMNMTQLRTTTLVYTLMCMLYSLNISLVKDMYACISYSVIVVKNRIVYSITYIKAELNAGESNEVINMVIVVIIGLALAPTVQSTVDDANLNGTMGTIADIIPILYIVAILALAAGYVYVKRRG